MVCETDWVQILFVQNLQHNTTVKLVVELSLPGWVRQLSMKGGTNPESIDHTVRLQTILKEQAIHLKYLRSLSDAGFRLGIIAEEGFWNAWIFLDGPPSKQLFAVLSPPKTSS